MIDWHTIKEKYSGKMKNKNKTKSARKVTLDELLNVLSFYADKSNYSSTYDEKLNYIPMPILEDLGGKSRKILKKLVKETLDKEGIKNNL